MPGQRKTNEVTMAMRYKHSRQPSSHRYVTLPCRRQETNGNSCLSFPFLNLPFLNPPFLSLALLPLISRGEHSTTGLLSAAGISKPIYWALAMVLSLWVIMVEETGKEGRAHFPVWGAVLWFWLSVLFRNLTFSSEFRAAAPCELRATHGEPKQQLLSRAFGTPAQFNRHPFSSLLPN